MKYEKQIKFTIKQILDSKDAMRVRYVVWDMSKEIKKKHIGKPSWEKPVIVSKITESREKIKRYTPKRFNELLRGRDYETAATHLIWMIALYKSLISYAKINESKLMKLGVTIDELDKINLAKEMRNRYVHDGGVVETKFIKVFNNVMKREPQISEGIILPEVKDIEEWNDIIIKITREIQKDLEFTL